ncbi:MAG TPA: hypothetical protein VIJ40_05135 [Acidimicrobiales bacterium]
MIGGAAAILVTAIQIVGTHITIKSITSSGGTDHSSVLTWKNPRWWTHPIYTSAAWNIKDSWATNLTVVGAVLGTVTSSTTFFPTPAASASTNFASSPHDTFMALAIFFGGAAALSPLIYATFAKKPDYKYPGQVEGSVIGLLVASMVTLFATVGELAAVTMIIAVSTATVGERVILIAALFVAAVFMAVYAIRSFWALAQADPPSTSSDTSGKSSGTASLMNSSGNSATL